MPPQACPSPTLLSGSLPAMSAVCTQRRALHPRPLLLSMCLRSPSPQSLPLSSLSTQWIAPRGTLLPVLCAQTHVCGQYDRPPEVGAPYKLRIDISYPTHMSQGLWVPPCFSSSGVILTAALWIGRWDGGVCGTSAALLTVDVATGGGQPHRATAVCPQQEADRRGGSHQTVHRTAGPEAPEPSGDSGKPGGAALSPATACCTLTLQLPVSMALHRHAVQHRAASRIGRSRISLSFTWDLGSHQSPAEAPRHL